MTQPPPFPPPPEPDQSALPPPEVTPAAHPTPPPPPPPPYGQQSYYAPHQPQSTNGFAIAALVFGIIGGCLLAIIFGIVALVQIRKTGQKGRGMAITGLVLSGVWLVVIAGLGTVGVLADLEAGTRTSPSQNNDRDDDVRTINLKVGDCFNGLEDSGELFAVDGISCTEPHESEVYALIPVNDEEFPGEQVLSRRAERQCSKKMQSDFPDLWADDDIGIYLLWPTATSWRIGDRSLACVATTEEKRSGSVLE